MVDASWAMANRGSGRFDAAFMIGATIPSFPAWVGGTAVGALAGDAIGDPDTYGLDAMFPAFFLALLLGELRTPRARGAALIGGAIAIALSARCPAGRADPRRRNRGPDRAASKRRTRASRARAARGPGMSEIWLAIGALAVTTALIRASGPVVVGGLARDPLLDHPRRGGGRGGDRLRAGTSVR